MKFFRRILIPKIEYELIAKKISERVLFWKSISQLTKIKNIFISKTQCLILRKNALWKTPSAKDHSGKSSHIRKALKIPSGWWSARKQIKSKTCWDAFQK